jgi:periplasmic divalent cation tolerance protein
MDELLVVLTNCPDEESAGRITAALIEGRLAACVNRLPAVSSTYRWQGRVERAQEIPLLIKCTRARYADVEAAIVDVHPYEVPEIIALPVTAGHAGYAAWVRAETLPGLRA